jgi:hypothetical protein
MHKVQEKYRKTRQRRTGLYTDPRTGLSMESSTGISRQQVPVAFNSLFRKRNDDAAGPAAPTRSGIYPKGIMPLPDFFGIPPGHREYDGFAPR